MAQIKWNQRSPRWQQIHLPMQRLNSYWRYVTGKNRVMRNEWFREKKAVTI
jgi:hypothetical protein